MTILENFLVWERGCRLTFRLDACSLPMVTDFIKDYTFASRADGGCGLRWTIAYNPIPSMEFLHPLVGPFFTKDFAKAARQLQALLDRLASGR